MSKIGYYGEHTVKCARFDCQNRITISEVKRQRGMCYLCLNRINEQNPIEELVNLKQ